MRPWPWSQRPPKTPSFAAFDHTGGTTWDGSFTCATCSYQTAVSASDLLIVDTDSTSDFVGARCLNGVVCELTLDGWTYTG